jgi:hypothetical protein
MQIYFVNVVLLVSIIYEVPIFNMIIIVNIFLVVAMLSTGCNGYRISVAAAV